MYIYVCVCLFVCLSVCLSVCVCIYIYILTRQHAMGSEQDLNGDKIADTIKLELEFAVDEVRGEVSVATLPCALTFSPPHPSPLPSSHPHTLFPALPHARTPSHPHTLTPPLTTSHLMACRISAPRPAIELCGRDGSACP